MGRSQRPPATGIVIRDATETDLPAIVEIYNAAIASRISTAQLEPVTVEGRREWFRAHSPSAISDLGRGTGRRNRRLAQFSANFSRVALIAAPSKISVYVSEQFRRRGVAQEIAGGSDARGRQLGMHSLVGLIFGHNEPSLALFRAAGFERWGLLPAVARLDETPSDLTIFGRHV